MAEQRPSQPAKPPRRDVHGVLLLDKPIGWSSNDALIRAKRLLWAKKAGHTGTLDPLATGLLPLCFGEATKFSQDLLEADKTYETVVRLGIKTSTADAEGEVLSERPVAVTHEQLRAAVGRFIGEIDQVPPMHSALKKDGKPLYEYARAGQTVERAARRVTIRAIDILATDLDAAAPTVTLRVCCSKGTYIRTLGEDLGEALGCGAHLVALRRTQVGSLTLDGAVTLQALEAASEDQRAALLAPVDALLQTLPRVELGAEDSRRFLHGQRLPLRLSLPGAEQVRVYGARGEAALSLLGVAAWQDGVLRPERLVHL
ncbi:tRNA pseudouridine(55) synthase TruB [Ralstonia solanacearum]|uniref:tRNA pseudouridine(55) synthase TruB n=1 Tax=Ralstonia solanacearum TaxID=305 RepID=UPI0001816419|nr:tRNA pseudouridine(55) synthase TruB [Ralstonia solanacearum]MDC6176942.1 tRNA pseudouridine(55) synthase TruB [Ralstonia solanacearum]MDC6211419.1 tRNA pseudouridine(55) synthase TruB [Ralstonia solanacearum]MDC6240804.1 tRNA pseudouridine(55) synthase TruB [Ralstonia solanacearum]MDD7800520.1 tRNA pseudouridine(55) synthase TruB [Ralstonia solanacearum]TYZ50794.1 tRNA pseudouridine(55) synthase TruB [Ralstonia solanacearum]